VDEPTATPQRVAGSRVRRVRRGLGTLLREARSWPALLLVLVTLAAAVPLAILLTPGQDVTTLGQHMTVRARPVSPSLAGPAQIVQIGNTSLDVPKLRVVGPLRPRLEMGPVVRSDEAARLLDPRGGGDPGAAVAHSVGAGWLHWCLWGWLVAVGVALAIAAAASSVRLLRGASWQRVLRMTVVSVAAVSLVWLASFGSSVVGAAGLRQVASFADLVGRYHLSPSPVGPARSGFEGAVIGDSRAARSGGPLVADPSDSDRDCGRSSDSLAAEVGLGLPGRVLNLACPSASIREGLMGPQQRSGHTLPPQVGVLKRVQDLKFVVVMVGPNDLWWSNLVQYCYAVQTCDDRLMTGDYQYRLTAFDRDYGDLLAELATLPSHPKVVVVTSYSAFDPTTPVDRACPDVRGPAGLPGLSPEKITFLTALNNQLNQVLAAGAEAYGYPVADPRLAPLCAPSPDGQGPDLQGVGASDPFHPTAVGMVRIATAVLRALAEPARDGPN
jgi:GDSL-like Lipase/Acylhydrolase family